MSLGRNKYGHNNSAPTKRVPTGHEYMAYAHVFTSFVKKWWHFTHTVHILDFKLHSVYEYYIVFTWKISS